MNYLISGIIVLLTAFAISAVAAYVSVTGMVAIFAASPIIGYIIFSTLEVGKLVGAQWLHSNWRNAKVSFAHKTYMIIAVIVLMVITAFGVYGFLAKSHLDQKAPIEGISLQIAQKEQAITQISNDNSRLQARLDQLDANINSFLKGDKADRANQVRRTQQVERKDIEKEIKANNEKVNAINAELLPLKMSSSDVTAKLGPIKFVAELFGWEDTGAAVRILILMIMFAFDPLAVIMMLSGFITLSDWADSRKRKVADQTPIDEPQPKPESEESPTVAEAVNEPFKEFIDAPQETVVEPEPEPASPVAEPLKPKRKYTRKKKDDQYQNKLQAVAALYQGNPKIDADVNELVNILEKRPDLLDEVLDVAMDLTKKKVDLPAGELTPDTGKAASANDLKTNVPQEKIDSNIRTANTWLASARDRRTK